MMRGAAAHHSVMIADVGTHLTGADQPERLCAFRRCGGQRYSRVPFTRRSVRCLVTTQRKNWRKAILGSPAPRRFGTPKTCLKRTMLLQGFFAGWSLVAPSARPQC